MKNTVYFCKMIEYFSIIFKNFNNEIFSQELQDLRFSFSDTYQNFIHMQIIMKVKMNDLGEKIKNPELSNIWIKIGLSAKNCFLYYCKLKNDLILSGNKFFNLVNAKKFEEEEYEIFLNLFEENSNVDLEIQLLILNYNFINFSYMSLENTFKKCLYDNTSVKNKNI